MDTAARLVGTALHPLNRPVWDEEHPPGSRGLRRARPPHGGRPRKAARPHPFLLARWRAAGGITPYDVPAGRAVHGRLCRRAYSPARACIDVRGLRTWLTGGGSVPCPSRSSATTFWRAPCLRAGLVSDVAMTDGVPAALPGWLVPASPLDPGRLAERPLPVASPPAAPAPPGQVEAAGQPAPLPDAGGAPCCACCCLPCRGRGGALLAGVALLSAVSRPAAGRRPVPGPRRLAHPDRPLLLPRPPPGAMGRPGPGGLSPASCCPPPPGSGCRTHGHAGPVAAAKPAAGCCSGSPPPTRTSRRLGRYPLRPAPVLVHPAGGRRAASVCGGGASRGWPDCCSWRSIPLSALVGSSGRPARRAGRLSAARARTHGRRLRRRHVAVSTRSCAPRRITYLPPDNLQESPVWRVAHRTSPTNIGLYLLLCRWPPADFGFIDEAGMLNRGWTGRRPPRWKSWKNGGATCSTGTTPAPCGPCPPGMSPPWTAATWPAAWWRLRQAAAGAPQRPGAAAGRPHSARCTSQPWTSPPCTTSGGPCSISAWIPDTGEASPSYYDLLMSESRMTGYFAIATRRVSKKHWGALGRTLARICRLCGAGVLDRHHVRVFHAPAAAAGLRGLHGV